MSTEAESSQTPPDGSGPAARGPLSGPALFTAIVVLLAFAVFVAYMVGQVDTDSEVSWTRLAWLFASVEAIAFGAAGAIFGATIQRQRAETAEAKVGENAEGAANGRALAAALEADAPLVTGASQFESFGSTTTPEAELARRHAQLARKLFP